MVGFYARLGEQLSRFVRQRAWLGTAPDKGRNEKIDPPPRITAMTERGQHIPIPPNPAPYLTDWLFEIGPAQSGGMALAAIGWRDMAAWQDLTGIELLPWEARLLRRLSHDFVAMCREARSPACPMPWDGIETDQDVNDNRAKVSRQLKAMFGGLKKAKG